MKVKGKVWKFGDDVDTDAIIPARYLNTSDPQELAQHCMEDADASFAGQVQPGDIIIAGKNFGCGSSREHAPWALADFGIRVILAPSFADIFFNNCFKNGILPVMLESGVVDRLFGLARGAEALRIAVDLPVQTLTPVGAGGEGETIPFTVDAFRKQCLVEGLDDIGLTLQHLDAIRAYEERRRVEVPWLFA